MALSQLNIVHLFLFPCRFKTNTRLCLSISDYHPDTWNPAWSVSTILTGLLSFMVSSFNITDSFRLMLYQTFSSFHFYFIKVESTPTLGSLETSDIEKQQLAHRSLEFNINDSVFCELFPDLATVSIFNLEFCFIFFFVLLPKFYILFLECPC